MKRRDFITLVGGAAAAWPVQAHAQQTEPVRRIGVLINRTADDRRGQAAVAAFKQGLEQLGWRDGRDARIDVRWGANIPDLERKFASELIATNPDVLLASGTLSVAALQNISRTLPIVFVGVSDPVGAGFVDNLAQPSGNATGFMLFEYSLSGKWLELLKQIVPSLSQAAVLRDAANPAGVAQFGAIRATASSLGVDVSPINIHDAGEIERGIADFARSPSRGLVVTPSASEREYGDLIIALAARYKLPAVYGFGFHVASGGLISYGPDFLAQFRTAGGYIDRILKGAKVADLPVQAPTKFELVINLKTAKALGISIPDKLLATADEVIE